VAEIDMRKVFADGCIGMHLESDTKEGVIREMVDMLVAAGQVTDRQAVLDAVFERERQNSTGMQHGVAMPHARTESIGHLVAAFALKKEGVAFESMDGAPSRIFVMTLSSVLGGGAHMRFLGDLGKRLRCAEVRARLLQAETPEDILGILSYDAGAAPCGTPSPGGDNGGRTAS